MEIVSFQSITMYLYCRRYISIYKKQIVLLRHPFPFLTILHSKSTARVYDGIPILHQTKQTNRTSQYDCRYLVRCLSKHKLKYGLPPLVSTAAHSKAVVLLLFVAPIVCGDFVWSLLCCSVLCILSSLAIISLGKTELIALLLLSSWCHVAASVSWFRGLVSSV